MLVEFHILLKNLLVLSSSWLGRERLNCKLQRKSHEIKTIFDLLYLRPKAKIIDF